MQLASDGAALVVEGDEQWLELEDGVKIQFQARDPNNPYTYRTGDYWLIPARVATGAVEWPTFTDSAGDRTPLAQPPHGIEHHYARLGIATVNAQGAISVTPCCKQFSPLAQRPAYDYALAGDAIGATNLSLPRIRTRRTRKLTPDD